MEKINLTLLDNTAIVNVLEGKLPEPINPKTQEISGTIDAPSEFWMKRNEILKPIGAVATSDNINFNPDATYVEFDYKNATIKLVVAAAHPSQITVNGEFILNSIFAELNINTKEPYSDQNVLLGIIRYKSNIFETIEAHKDFLSRLRNFTARATKEYKQYSDQKGNAGKSQVVELQEFTPLDFEIFVPIFNGEAKSKIKIEIEIEERNGSLVFFLVSAELPRLIESYKEQKFADLKANFVGIPVINK